MLTPPSVDEFELSIVEQLSECSSLLLVEYFPPSSEVGRLTPDEAAAAVLLKRRQHAIQYAAHISHVVALECVQPARVAVTVGDDMKHVRGVGRDGISSRGDDRDWEDSEGQQSE